MCEWLSRDEWCDVSLLCGGRAFGAHRAVLSSVSSFLRRILLSCPIEETPTLIVLPDFDLEALTAVLYYIYNGEVSMPRHKLGMFLDIAEAMQIYIDQQYLTQLSINIDIKYSVNKCVTEERFVLRSENEDNSSLVTFRKLFQNTFPRYTNASDYNGQTQNLNEHFKPVLGNLQSAHGGRQRDYFLRDSFMETYPRNRNANGRAVVPAIPSRSYLSPTSAFLTNTNANGYSPDTVNPSDNDAASLMPYNLKLASHLLKPYQDSITLSELHRKISTHTSDFPSGQTTGTSVESLLTKKHTSYLYYNKLQKAHTAMPPSVVNKMSVDTFSRLSGLANMDRVERPSYSKDTNLNKVSILNKALESPWCPRLPSSFRPFRRKEPSLNPLYPNDDNNNIQVKTERVENEADLHTRNSTHFSPTPASSHEDDKDSPNHQPCTESQSRSRYTCTECGKTFSQLRNFKYHMSVHRGTREFAASCAVCGKSFNDRGYLSSHMKIHRNRKEYKCSQCPKSFNQRVAYNMHVRIHTGIKPHVCPTCGKAFSRKMLLKQHQRTHSGERPYACPHCEKRFADRSNMTLHLRLHTGVKPFKCPMCPKSFTKKHHLKSHVNFHTGAKPYSCPRCRLAFTQSSNMRTHLKRCTAPEPTDVTAEVST